MCTIFLRTKRVQKGEKKMRKEEIGKRLRELRGEKPQAETANALGISTSALSMYECGSRIPRDEIKIRIAKYYGKTIEEIFFAS